ncbi:hypothetical protein BRN51_16380 [Xanthomonas oryzae pv. oryzae]|uniref:Uncharacterized protein n=1 Tax=Xanthomonas oryzae pv. oryzae (strain PXO99A) TaxID=360094 RepID=A0A0K0GMX7_XANOP|nr:hypothetical protein PXO_06037 [Xanthomonas oryzae pv. oryzae PXO99A]AXM40696.1 hypothetical protein BRN51_16380 [Xanthomonas oryzae pv. oryzae]QIE16643.1 hypothetical protein IXO1088_017065 [Xanthomonas oryzae pv. oryzae]RBI38628.1 hypothetical protein BRL69_14750 [Xanthomonas oryzae pv. oryzae]RBI46274.1 hypothetical protein BRL99_14160 [Xanthomonas oryzae pv. oryzae]
MRASNGWFGAQEPRFVDAGSHAPQRVAPSAKHAEALALTAAVEAHRLAGGNYVVLDGTPATPAPRRRPGA